MPFWVGYNLLVRVKVGYNLDCLMNLLLIFPLALAYSLQIRAELRLLRFSPSKGSLMLIAVCVSIWLIGLYAMPLQKGHISYIKNLMLGNFYRIF